MAITHWICLSYFDWDLNLILKKVDEKIDEDREQNPRPYVAPDFLDLYDIIKI